MDDEVLRQKYINLRSNLYYIKNKINNLVDIHNTTYSNLSDAILVDKEIIAEDEFYDLKKSSLEIINELNNTVIPIINNRIY